MILFCTLNADIVNVHVHEKPHLVKARSWQEAYRLLRLETSVRLLPCSFPAKAVMDSPRILAPQRKWLSKCQDPTIYPQMRPLGRGATFQALWGRVTCSRSSWRLGIKNKALAPWWFIADPLAHIKDSIAGYFSLLNCHENEGGDPPPPPPLRAEAWRWWLLKAANKRAH